jgi:hypothetical protein
LPRISKRYSALDRSFVNCCASRFIFLGTSIFVRFCPVLLFEFQGLKAGNHGKSSCSARVNEQSTSLPPSQRAPGHTYCKISKNKDVNPDNSSFLQLVQKNCNIKIMGIGPLPWNALRFSLELQQKRDDGFGADSRYSSTGTSFIAFRLFLK